MARTRRPARNSSIQLYIPYLHPMYEGWVVIEETRFIQAAEIKKGMLEEHDIPCFIMNLQDTMNPQIGEIQLLVAPEHVMKAKYLMSRSSEEEE